MSTTPSKPSKRTRQPVLDYHECRDYLQAKHGYDERDYAGCYDPKRGAGRDDSLPYQDFWHWVVDVCGVTNGGTITFSNDLLSSCKEPWQAEILERYLAEFGEGDDRSCTFLTEW